MPNAPKTFRPAGVPTPQENRKQYDRNRGTYRERGYSKEWDRLKAWLKGQPEFVLCACGCEQLGEPFDHIVAVVFDQVGKQYVFKHRHQLPLVEKYQLGTPYEAFHSPTNLQRLTRNCHSAKTARYDGTGGRIPDASAEGMRLIEAMLVAAKQRTEAINARGFGF